MPYYSQPDHIPTVLEALNQQTVDQLKALTNLLPAGKIPTRKAELVSYVHQGLQGESLKRLWQQCDRRGAGGGRLLQRAHYMRSRRWE